MAGTPGNVKKDKAPNTEGAPKETRPSSRIGDHIKVTDVKVLLLTFEYHGLRRDFTKETKRVQRAFTGLKYEVIPKKIPMQDFFEKLKTELDQFLETSKSTLCIIYYNGHGRLKTSNGEFTI